MIANDPEALADFREAVTGEPHRPKKESGYNITSNERVTGTGKAYTLSRLAMGSAMSPRRWRSTSRNGEAAR